MSGFKLYEITEGFRILEDQMADEDAEISEAELFSNIDLIDGLLTEKATSIGKLIGNMDATAKAIKEAEGQMARRRKALENRIKSIKAYLVMNMQKGNITKIECEFFKITLRNNPMSIVIDDEKLIPSEYMKQPEPPPPAPDKKKMLADIKEGVVIDGVHATQTQSVMIR